MRPAVSSSLMWWESVAGEMARASPSLGAAQRTGGLGDAFEQFEALGIGEGLEEGGAVGAGEARRFCGASH